MKGNIYATRYEESDFSPIHPDVQFGRKVRIGHCAVIEQGCEIGDNTYIGNFAIIRANSRIGRNCRIGHYVIFEGRGNIGDNVTIMPHGQICLDAIIEDNVFIGPMYIGLNTQKIAHGRGKPVYDPPIIRRCARIGGGVILMPGVEIGENALIAAGSLVTRSVPARMIAMGAPARIKGHVPIGECL